MCRTSGPRGSAIRRTPPRSGQVTNFGVHYIDMLRWALGQDAPLSLVARGERFPNNPAVNGLPHYPYRAGYKLP